uniref:Uncharacterized protein n=1 Tax=Amphimedon queenslandica TaxID=400682 RepID=A0A1X7UUZ5_AMPQE
MGKGKDSSSITLPSFINADHCDQTWFLRMRRSSVDRRKKARTPFSSLYPRKYTNRGPGSEENRLLLYYKERQRKKQAELS